MNGLSRMRCLALSAKAAEFWPSWLTRYRPYQQICPVGWLAATHGLLHACREIGPYCRSKSIVQSHYLAWLDVLLCSRLNGTTVFTIMTYISTLWHAMSYMCMFVYTAWAPRMLSHENASNWYSRYQITPMTLSTKLRHCFHACLLVLTLR